MTQDYSIRHYRHGEEQAMADLVNASQGDDEGFPITPDMIHDEWNDARLDLDADSWVAVDSNGRYIAAAEVWFEDEHEEEEVIARHIGFTMLPEYRESHPELMERLFRQAVEHASSRPVIPERDYYLRAWASAGDEWKKRWILDHGFSYMHCGFTLLRESLSDLPPVPAVEGIRIETWSVERDYDLWQALNAVLSIDATFVPLSWEEWNEVYHAMGKVDPSLWRLAIDIEQEEIAGFALAEIVDIDPELGSPHEGWVTDLAAAEPWQGKGVERALLISTLHGLREAGLDLALMGVDIDNPDNMTELYGRLGFRVLRGSCTFDKPLRRVSP